MTIAHDFTDTSAGIYPGQSPLFIAMRLIAVGIGHVVLPRLFAAPPATAESRRTRQG